MIKEVSLPTACSITAFSAQVQDASPDTLVITADHSEQPHSTVLILTTVVTRQDINRWQSASVNDVLRRLPSMGITQNGGSGQLSSILIRGTNASHVLVSIDSTRLNLAGVSGSTDLNQFPIALIQRVGYIRGPRSAAYGSDVIDGVANIIMTRDHPRTEISAGWGSNSCQSYDVSTQRQLGDKARATLLGGYAHTHGYNVVAYGDTGMQTQSDNDGFLSKTLYSALEHSFTDVWSSFVCGYGYDNRTNYDAYYSPGLPLVDIRKLYG